MSSAWCAQKVHESCTDTHQTWSSSSWPIQNLTTTQGINYSTTEAHISSQTPDTKGNPLADINAKIDASQENSSPKHLHTSPWSPSFRDRNYLKSLLDNCWYLGLKNLLERKQEGYFVYSNEVCRHHGPLSLLALAQMWAHNFSKAHSKENLEDLLPEYWCGYLSPQVIQIMSTFPIC